MEESLWTSRKIKKKLSGRVRLDTLLTVLLSELSRSGQRGLVDRVIQRALEEEKEIG